jgi:hypothetical protein
MLDYSKQEYEDWFWFLDTKTKRHISYSNCINSKPLYDMHNTIIKSRRIYTDKFWKGFYG